VESVPSAILDAATMVFAGLGVFFFFVGTIGLLRFPDFYSRTHAATKCDTLGAGSMLFALALHQGLEFDSAKIIVIALFVLVSSPTAGHALARAAYRTGLTPWRPHGEQREE
jgi:monovalent cation/proton antiporter MnhG/PhaG subunit